MPTPSASSRTKTALSTSLGHGNVANAGWRCTRCDKLLGIYRDGKMHIRSGRGPEYLTAFPVTSACGCGTLNRAASAAP